jgi:hypothetical protein
MIWGFAAAFGFLVGFWLYETYGPRARAWLVKLLTLPENL